MKIFFLTLFILSHILAFSQKCVFPVFTAEMLENPSKYTDQFDRIFAYNEISKFRDKNSESKLIFENGYAAYNLKNFDDWIKIKAGKKVKSITFVYTKYPRKKKDWIMNYNELLANRLKALFKMDSALNRNDIKWYLLLQTDCKNDKEARTFFHGVVITFESSKANPKTETFVNVDTKNQKKISVADSVQVTDINAIENKQKWQFLKENDYDYSSSFINRSTTSFNKKKKQLKVPGCPDFSKKTFKGFF